MAYTPHAKETENFRLVRSGYYQLDGQLGWLPRAQISGEHPYNGTLVPFHTNSRGLRDREYSLEKPAGITRIVALGDSYTWGYRVRDEEVYTEVLESLLPHMEVINLGVTAFMTDQELQYLKREGLAYDPDIVLLAFCLNDFDEADGKVVRRVNATTGKASEERPVSQSWMARIKRQSVLFAWIRDRLNTNRLLVKMLARLGLREPLGEADVLDVSLLPALKEPPASFPPLIEMAQAKILEIYQELASRSIRLIVVLIPSPFSADKDRFTQAIAVSRFEESDFDLDQPYRLMEKFARTNHIELINPVNVFRQSHSYANPLYLFRDMHFSPIGHRVFAQEIYEYLMARP